jgi:predicted  nucleic acid-binding Zn-ribbon protein
MNELELKLEALSQRIGLLASRYEVELASMRAEATLSYNQLQQEFRLKNEELEKASRELDDVNEQKLAIQQAMNNLSRRYEYCVSLLNENGIEFTDDHIADSTD